MKLIYVFILLSLCNSTIILRDNDSLPLTLFINNRIYLYVKGNAYTYDSNGNDQQFLKSYINYDTSAYQQYEAGKVYLLYDTYFYEEDTLQYTLPSSSSPTKTFSFLTYVFIVSTMSISLTTTKYSITSVKEPIIFPYLLQSLH